MMSHANLEQNEFRRMVLVSASLHLIVVAAVLRMTSFQRHRYMEAVSPGPMNVLWAETVKGPAITPPNKLPPPIVPIQTEPQFESEKPKVVLPEHQAKIEPDKKPAIKDLEEEARRKAMEEAIAGIRKNMGDDRPIPKPDNFPSKGLRKEEGLPQGPSGIAGLLGGDPVFGQYKNQIRKIITNNFVWLQKRSNLRAEITFTIDITGNILNPLLTKASGDPAYDNAVLRAVRKSSPLPPPPPEFAKNLVNEPFVVIFDPKTL